MLDPVAATAQVRGFPKMMVRAFFLPDEGRMKSLGRVRHWKKRKLKAKVLGLASLHCRESRLTSLGTNPPGSLRPLWQLGVQKLMY